MYDMYYYVTGAEYLSNEWIAHMLECEASEVEVNAPNEIAHIALYREAARRLRDI